MRVKVEQVATPLLVTAGILAASLTVLAALSPLQSGRETIWIFGSFTGVLAAVLLPVQPLLAQRQLVRARRGWHAGLGALILVLTMAHMAGLWISSPEDVIDALLLRAPTPFPAWGLAGVAGLSAAALLGLVRRGQMGQWRVLHSLLAAAGALSALVHARLILGTLPHEGKSLLIVVTIASLAVTTVPLAQGKKPRR